MKRDTCRKEVAMANEQERQYPVDPVTGRQYLVDPKTGKKHLAFPKGYSKHKVDCPICGKLLSDMSRHECSKAVLAGIESLESQIEAREKSHSDYDRLPVSYALRMSQTLLQEAGDGCYDRSISDEQYDGTIHSSDRYHGKTSNPR